MRKMPENKTPHIRLVTKVHCTHCGWHGKVEQCTHTENNEVIEGNLESYIIDLCPECGGEITYD